MEKGECSRCCSPVVFEKVSCLFPSHQRLKMPVPRFSWESWLVGPVRVPARLSCLPPSPAPIPSAFLSNRASELFLCSGSPPPKCTALPAAPHWAALDPPPRGHYPSCPLCLLCTQYALGRGTGSACGARLACQLLTGETEVQWGSGAAFTTQPAVKPNCILSALHSCWL